jgi:DNA modification methylase
MKNSDKLTYKIMVGDALKLIAEVEDKSVTLIWTDPPFDISNASRLTKRGGKLVQGELFDWEIENYDQYMEKLFPEFWRILKPNGNLVLFYSWHKIDHFVSELKKIGFIPRNLIALGKKNPVPHITHKNFRSTVELGFWFSKNKKKYTFNFLEQREMRNFVVYAIGQKETDHPAEKPVWIYKRYIEILSNKGDLVYDGFLGSGSTLIACVLSGRSCLASEKNPQFVRKIKKRTNYLFNTKRFSNDPLLNLQIVGELPKEEEPTEKPAPKPPKGQTFINNFIMS